ncbi:MAG: VapE family protein [Pseudomonas oryzihabitans]|uniref:VapE domain-containing protein n=1 Tax=Pseudomonas oryzihabitans TaxID=47885 RepID=UPI0011A1C81B|nr:VapE domain-containing protein [Pseudomonas oryzihabitans]MDU4059431.1 VapE family protein [Pseudomonas oryzihabitans]
MNAPALNLPDVADAERFLAVLDPTATSWTFQTFDDSPEKRRELAGIRHGTLAQHRDWLVRQSSRGAGVFVCINETDGQGRKLESITRIRALFADFDDTSVDAWAALDQFEHAPAMVVESSAGKFHAYWPIESLPPADFKPLNRQLAVMLGSDTKINDPCRVMRLPGFPHQKTAPQLVRLIESSSARYGLELADTIRATMPEDEPRPVSVPDGRRAPASADRFAAGALDSAYGRVAKAGDGTRNNTLNSEAFSLAQLVAGGSLTREQAVDTLLEAAKAAGLSKAEAEQTINSAFTSPRVQPRGPAERAERRASGSAVAAGAQVARENDATRVPQSLFEAVQALAEVGVDLAVNLRMEPYNNLANGIAILRHHPTFAGLIWYDTFRQEIMTTWDCEQPRVWVDADKLRVTEYFQRKLGMVKFGDDTVEKAVIAVAQDDQRDELAGWLNGLQWDGQPRLEGWMAKAAGAARDEYHDAVGNNFLRSLVARGLNPGAKVDTMPVFEGAQGSNKSTMLSVLGGQFYAELTESLETKDFFVVLQGVWLMEMGELQAMSKADVTRIKQVLSSSQDRCRLPYAKRAVNLPRRVVFAGTTNEDEYLRDSTGARRFWPVRTAKIDLAWLRDNREQLFAEAVAQVKDGATWWEMPQEMAAAIAGERRETDPWEDTVADATRGKRATTVTEVLDAMGVPVAQRGKREEMRLSGVLKGLGFSRIARRINGRPMKVWERNLPGDQVEAPF